MAGAKSDKMSMSTFGSSSPAMPLLLRTAASDGINKLLTPFSTQPYFQVEFAILGQELIIF